MTNQKARRKPIAPYFAVGLSTSKRGISKRSDCMINLKTIESHIHGAMSIVSIQLPVKIVALAEGAIQGFTDEIFDVDHVTFAREVAIEIPGEETEFLGELARQYQTYIIGQAKARWPEVIKDRYFNTSFIIDPKGKVIHKAAKNHVFPREHSCTPHDVYDIWVKKFGDTIDAFFPVCHTPDVGNIGTGVCNDGVFLEWGRALALNGAEVLYRPSMPQPLAGNGMLELQNRAHALFNNCYVIAPQSGPNYIHPATQHAFDMGANSHIVDYRGNVISSSPSARDTIVAAMIDIEQLRHFRETALWGNWIKDLRTELFKKMYQEPIHPRNLWIDREPLHHAEHDEIYRNNVKRARRRGIYTPAAERFEGVQYIHPVKDPDKRSWEELRKLWNS